MDGRRKASAHTAASDDRSAWGAVFLQQRFEVAIAHRLNTIDNVDQIYFVNSCGVALAGSMEHAVDVLLRRKRES